MTDDELLALGRGIAEHLSDDDAARITRAFTGAPERARELMQARMRGTDPKDMARWALEVTYEIERERISFSTARKKSRRKPS